MDFFEKHEVAARARQDVRAGMLLAEVMANAFRSLNEQYPLPLWDEFTAIDFTEDVRLVGAHIPAILTADPPPPDLAAIWFRLCEVDNPALAPNADKFAAERTESVIELSGSTTYPNDDWLFNQEWYPAGFLPTPGLAGLASAGARTDEELVADGRLAATPGPDVMYSLAYDVATYDLAYAYSLALAAEVMRGPAAEALMEGRIRLGVASGFGSGDITLIGELNPTGFDVGDLPWI